MSTTGLKTMHDELTTMANDLPDYTPSAVSELPFDSTKVYVPNWDNCPVACEPLLKLNDGIILTRQNIALITAGAGIGKTAVMHSALTTIVNPDAETLGVSAYAAGAEIIDTEHDTRLFNLLWQRFMSCCGLQQGDKTPENIRWHNIRGMQALDERLAFLWYKLDAPDCMPLVVIDGIGDFVADPNNSDECTDFVYRLLATAQSRDIGIWLSLHNNPVANNEKARGVLGSELWRKSQSTIIIKRLPDGIRQITTDYSLGKNRQGSDTLTGCFKWSDEHHRHVPCAAPAQAKGKTDARQKIIVKEMGAKQWSYTDLVTLIMTVTGNGQRSARGYIPSMISSGLIEKTDTGLYVVSSAEHWSDNI